MSQLKSVAYVISFSLLLACSSAPQVDPMVEAITTYKAAIEPPLQKSEEISKTFVQLVLDGNGTVDPAKAVQSIQSDAMPKAQAYLDAVTAIKPPDGRLAELHGMLVRSATLKLEGYKAMVEGYNANNLPGFQAGYAKAKDSRIVENEFIVESNKFLNPYGQKIDFYATSGTSSAPAAPAPAPAVP